MLALTDTPETSQIVEKRFVRKPDIVMRKADERRCVSMKQVIAFAFPSLIWYASAVPRAGRDLDADCK
jgi:hypothetical protein